MSWLARHFDTAKHFGSFSKDKTKCGAIAVTQDNRLLSQGWNGFPRGIKDTVERLENRDVKLQFVAHSEQNCIYNAAYNGVSLRDSLFFVHAPIHICNDCAKGIIQVGVKQVFMCIDPTRISDMWEEKFKISKIMFNEANLPWKVYKEVSGFRGYELIEAS